MKRRICIVTGTRAEYGLLRPVMRAVRDHSGLDLSIIVAGAHLLPPAETWREVEQDFGSAAIGARVPMQEPEMTGRIADARAAGRGIIGFSDAFSRLSPDWVVVLGDRIEAFAAASAASIGGFAVAHIHGGDRAEGIADEAMRHAITKLAHLHLCATEQSATRVIRMGEREEHVMNVGSPAADGIADVPLPDDVRWEELGRPRFMIVLHPTGNESLDGACAACILEAVRAERSGRGVLWLHPNHDPGREAILDIIARAGRETQMVVRDHLPHDAFRSMLKRLGEEGGVLVGNSSAGLIEAAMLRCPTVDVGPRQAGRERPNNVIHTEGDSVDQLRGAILRARRIDRSRITHPYGDGRTGPRIAGILARFEARGTGLLRKLNAY